MCAKEQKKLGTFVQDRILRLFMNRPWPDLDYGSLKFMHKAVTFFEAPTEKNELGFRKGGLDSRRPNFDDLN